MTRNHYAGKEQILASTAQRGRIEAWTMRGDIEHRGYTSLSR